MSILRQNPEIRVFRRKVLFQVGNALFRKKMSTFLLQRVDIQSQNRNQGCKILFSRAEQKVASMLSTNTPVGFTKMSQKIFFSIKLLLKIDLTIYQKNFSLFEGIYGHRKRIRHSFGKTIFLIIMFQSNNFLLSVTGHSANIFLVQIKLTGRRRFSYQ